MKLSEDFKHNHRLFVYYYQNGTLPFLVGGVLDGVEDYREIMVHEASATELVFSIYNNVVEMDEKGMVTNHSAAMKRAAQQLRSYLDPDYEVEPPFEQWEIELH